MKCPHVFCKNCVEAFRDEFGEDLETVSGLEITGDVDGDLERACLYCRRCQKKVCITLTRTAKEDTKTLTGKWKKMATKGRDVGDDVHCFQPACASQNILIQEVDAHIRKGKEFFGSSKMANILASIKKTISKSPGDKMISRFSKPRYGLHAQGQR